MVKTYRLYSFLALSRKKGLVLLLMGLLCISISMAPELLLRCFGRGWSAMHFFFSFFHLCVCERKRERFAMNLLKGMLMMLLYSFIVKMIIDINERHGVLRSWLNVFD